jgi:hypothetical protein
MVMAFSSRIISHIRFYYSIEFEAIDFMFIIWFSILEEFYLQIILFLFINYLLFININLKYFYNYFFICGISSRIQIHIKFYYSIEFEAIDFMLFILFLYTNYIIFIYWLFFFYILLFININLKCFYFIFIF